MFNLIQFIPSIQTCQLRKQLTCGNISVGRDGQLERFEIPIKVLTAERNAVPKTVRKKSESLGHIKATTQQPKTLLDLTIRTKKMIRIFIFCVFLGLVSCAKTESNYPPKDLDEAIQYFESNWTDKAKNDFINDSLKNAHFSTGLWIRNNWIRGKRDTCLVNYFNELGIYHPDDISSIILKSLLRKLQNKPIELEKQINVYKAYWDPIIECKKNQRLIALRNYKKYKIGDNITIQMPVDTDDNQRNAVQYMCPKVDWVFNPKIDLNIIGVIEGKYFINDSSNGFFKVKITNLNFKNTTIFSEEIKLQDTIEFSIKGLTIK